MEVSMSDSLLELLMHQCDALSEEYAYAPIFIGGIAVYTHGLRAQNPYIETTHDADFYISLEGMQCMRNDKEISQTPRLGKSEWRSKDFSFDIYVEYQSKLIVPYDEVAGHALSIGPKRIACLEHLLALKLEAYLSRHDSEKGNKDARDLVCIALLSTTEFNPLLCVPYLRDEHLVLLRDLAKHPVLSEMAHRNVVEIKKFRTAVESLYTKVEAAYNTDEPSPP